MFSNSSINWCEEDYVVCNFIAEFWNSITGIFLCLSSIYCYYKNKKENIHILMYSNILLFFVGIGTALFHGTLIYIWQLFDEIPMMLIVIEYTRIVRHLTLIKQMNVYTLNNYYMYMTIPIIILSYYINPKLQILTFQGSLTIFTICLLYTFNKLNNNLNKEFYDKYNSNSDTIWNCTLEFKKYSKIRSNIKYYNRNGLYLLLISLVIWNIDNHFCQHYIQLHAIWHFTTSLGMYYCNEIMKSYILLEKQFYQSESKIKFD